MSCEGLDNFGGYQKALALFDLVVADMKQLQNDSRCYRLVAQQVGSADSICANIEEGYGRLSRVEYTRFLDIARGSARETRGRYARLKHWLPADVLAARVGLADEIIGILTSSIAHLRSEPTPSKWQRVGEEGSDYGSVPLTLDPQPSALRHPASVPSTPDTRHSLKQHTGPSLKRHRNGDAQ